MEKNAEKTCIPLNTLCVGKSALIERVDMPSALRLRLADFGMNIGSSVKCIGASPLGDPRAYLARGRVIAIRAVDAKNIICKM